MEAKVAVKGETLTKVERNKIILEMMEKGATRREIADKVNLTVSSVNRILNELEVDLDKFAAIRKKNYDDSRAEMLQLAKELVLNQGKSIQETAKAMNTTKCVIEKIIREAGIDLGMLKQERSLEKAKKVLQMSKEGLNEKQIASNIGLSRSRVSIILKKGEKYIEESERILENKLDKDKKGSNHNGGRKSKEECEPRTRKEILMDKMIEDEAYFQSSQKQLKQQLEAGNYKPVMVFIKEFLAINQYAKAEELIKITRNEEYKFPQKAEYQILEWQKQIEKRQKKASMKKEIMDKDGKKLTAIVEKCIEKKEFYTAKAYIDIAINYFEEGNMVSITGKNLKKRVSDGENQSIISRELVKGKDISQIASILNVPVVEIKRLIEKEQSEQEQR